MDPSTTDEPLVAEPAHEDAVHTLLVDALAEKRWFPAKGTRGRPAPLARLTLQDPAAEADVEIRLLVLPTGAVLQVPLTVRGPTGPGGPDGAAPVEPGGVLGVVDGRTVRDGCEDPAFVRAWLAVAGPGTAQQPATAVASMRVLSGEQSNTSVLLPDARPPAILKVFRVLTAGPSPDVEVPLALSRLGWRGVPRPLAWLAGAWPAPGSGTGGVPAPGAPDAPREVGHLGVLSELVLGAEDGFALACRYAREGVDLGELAEELGRTTAQMHHALRTALPGSGTASAAEVVATLRERAETAFAAVAELRPRADRVTAVLAGIEDVTDLPPLQRVHGDYHLGQVLHSPAGWSVLDFEGEPQASAAERTRPDLALRDLAGMLRSIDYAAAVGGAASPAWATRARDRLVAGYAAEADAGTAGRRLLRALELDKALYEVVYEARNRPTWVQIPLTGVDRLLAEAV